ncbi:ABC transporter substrate-binding protein [Belnapia sp. T6]|uniref:ABC transporter substrate-binding protein n=1 Tax=Belnapia mucosa TaxID=2804532 RepID=A0ABS1VA79_9PROT|nr:ABC transporter substrate-binding protein [Belnapia mucosa]MBL6457624.1 ABC transporter substrate-binding protein [Belnapia mucosa]
MITRPTRRGLLRGTGGLVAAALPLPALAQGAAPPKPDRIVVNASGGAMNSIFRRSYFAEFEKLHGIRVVDTSPVDFGKLRAMVNTGNPEWTVTEIGGQDGLRAKALNLLEPIDPAIVDRSSFPEVARDSHVFISSAYSTALGYRTDAFPNGGQPKGWAQFWDVKRFPGARSLRNHPTDNLEFALLADGVPMDKLYPLDMDRAFRKLDEIRPHITVWWTTGAQPAQLLVDKEVVLASGWNGRFFELTRRNAPVATEFTEGSLKSGCFGIPRGTRQAYWGQQFLQVMTNPRLQAIYATELSYAGLNPETINYVPEEIRPMLPVAPGNLAKQFWLDVGWWTENGAKAQERWTRWMLQR